MVYNFLEIVWHPVYMEQGVSVKDVADQESQETENENYWETGTKTKGQDYDNVDC